MCTVHWSGSQEERRGGVAYKYGGQCRGGGFEIYVIRERSAMRSAACGSQQHVQQQLSELGIYSYGAVFPIHLKSNLPRTCEIDVRGGRARGFIHTRREFRGRMRGRGCLCVSVFIPKKHLSSILRQGATQVFLWYKSTHAKKITRVRFPVGTKRDYVAHKVILRTNFQTGIGPSGCNFLCVSVLMRVVFIYQRNT